MNKAIKYIYKCVYKGSTVTIDRQEIEANEIQQSTHSVVNHPIHLDDMNMVACIDDPEGTADLLYKDAPTKKRWHNNQREPYKKYVVSLSRIVHVSPQDPLILPKACTQLPTVSKIFRGSPQSWVYHISDWLHRLADAAAEKMSNQLRQLFGMIFAYSSKRVVGQVQSTNGGGLCEKHRVE
ncbi:Helitron helicase-like protein [Phytophthora palmivora]|uniref:Helitron helicase-like protein n=1 Tax=Phytophthora palmivora TaxID=4796 RepID=A0A2P4Y1C9_9STRA|nr:Helitron helicase-like protein [Phytophthora palmivora]